MYQRDFEAGSQLFCWQHTGVSFLFLKKIPNLEANVVAGLK
jgi:hypothetical protein